MDKGKVAHTEQHAKIKALVSPELHHFINEHHITWGLMNKAGDQTTEDIYYKILGHIAIEISNHFKFEEEIILPKLRKYLSASNVGPLDKLAAEHRSINKKHHDVTELLANNGLTDEVKQQIKLLAYLVKKHIEKEDHFFFPLISLILSQAEKDDIKKKLEKATTLKLDETSFSQNEWRIIANDIKEWAKEAGEKLIESLDRPLTVKQKSADIDLVTEMDEWTEEFFKDKIRSKYPGHAMLTEETGEHEGSSDYKWVIDPIDGTANFFHGFPMFCISVAVTYKGETVVGVVYAPNLNELYEAVKGEGAFLNEKPIRVSGVKELSKSILATGFPYDKATDPINNVNNFTNVITRIGGIRRTGSAAIDLAQVAAGRFEGYWEFKLNPWDFEAGLLLVEEAGGKVLKLKQTKGYFILVGNTHIFELLQEILEY